MGLYCQRWLSDDIAPIPSEAKKIEHHLKRALLMLAHNVTSLKRSLYRWRQQGSKGIKMAGLRDREQPLNIAVRLFQLKERQRLDIQLKVMQFFYESTAGKYFAPS